MKKIFLTSVLALTLSTSVYAADATKSDQDVYLDGNKVSVQGYNIEGNNYFKLRDVAAILKNTDVSFNVDFNEDTGSIIINRFSNYTPLATDLSVSDDSSLEIQESFQQARVDTEKVKFTGYLINGNNYFKLRDLGKSLGFSVDYNEEARQVLISSKKTEPKSLIKTEDVKLVNLTAALSSNTKDYEGEISELNVYDFTKGISVVGRTDDGKQHALDIEYLEGDNVLLLMPIQLKYKGYLRLTPVLKIEQDGKSETLILNSKKIELNKLSSGIDLNEDFVVTLGYHEGEDTFKGLSVLNIKGGLK